MLLGTLVNCLAILGGGLGGLLFGNALPEKLKKTIIQGIGLAILLIGIQMALETKNTLIVIGSLVLGGIIGELVDIELRLEGLGRWLESNLNRRGKERQKEERPLPQAEPGPGEGNFTKGFVTTSLIFCVGAMAIMGSLESGLNGNHNILFAKALLDGITALVFASSLGAGVLLSALPVFLYQGLITVCATFLQGILSAAVIGEMSAVGGLLIVGIGLNILEIKQIKVGNLLPGIFIAIPLAYWFL